MISGEGSGKTMKLMNKGLVVLCMLLCGVVSCSEEKSTVKKYGNTLTQSYKSAKKLDKDLNVQQVQKSILDFSAANGRYPSDLGELSSFSGLTLAGDKYVYDPTTGMLTEKQ
jgi:hypothetical protein